MFQILFAHLFGHLPTVAHKYPRAQKCRPQERFFSSGNSSNSLVELWPLIQRMLSLGAMCRIDCLLF